jgi:hypothetical protein
MRLTTAVVRPRGRRIEVSVLALCVLASPGLAGCSEAVEGNPSRGSISVPRNADAPSAPAPAPEKKPDRNAPPKQLPGVAGKKLDL